MNDEIVKYIDGFFALGSNAVTDQFKRDLLERLVGVESQTFTTGQKLQARTNIGASSVETFLQLSDTPATYPADTYGRMARHFGAGLVFSTYLGDGGGAWAMDPFSRVDSPVVFGEGEATLQLGIYYLLTVTVSNCTTGSTTVFADTTELKTITEDGTYEIAFLSTWDNETVTFSITENDGFDGDLTFDNLKSVTLTNPTGLRLMDAVRAVAGGLYWHNQNFAFAKLPANFLGSGNLYWGDQSAVDLNEVNKLRVSDIITGDLTTGDLVFKSNLTFHAGTAYDVTFPAAGALVAGRFPYVSKTTPGAELSWSLYSLPTTLPGSASLPVVSAAGAGTWLTESAIAKLSGLTSGYLPYFNGTALADSYLKHTATELTIEQNSVQPFTSVAAGAVDNTLYLKEGKVGIGSAATLTAKFNIVGSGGLLVEGNTANAYIQINDIASRRASIRFQSGGVDKWSIGRGDTDELSDAYFYITPGNSGGTASKFVFTDAGKFGIQQPAPTAYLHIAAGTATAGTSPLKFTSGTLLTAPEAGAVEFLTDAYYATITTGTARKTFAFLESPVFTGTVTTPAIKITTGAAAGYFLTSAADGTASWAAITSSKWVTDTYGIKYDAGKVGIGGASKADESLYVYGAAGKTAIGAITDTTIAISGTSTSSVGIYGASTSGVGVQGDSTNSYSGYFGGTHGLYTSKLTIGNLVFPTTDGTANQVLKTNGSGVLEWVTVAASLWTTDTYGITYNVAGKGVGIGTASVENVMLKVVGASQFESTTGSFAVKASALTTNAYAFYGSCTYSTALGCFYGVDTQARGVFRGEGTGSCLDLVSTSAGSHQIVDIRDITAGFTGDLLFMKMVTTGGYYARFRGTDEANKFYVDYVGNVMGTGSGNFASIKVGGTTRIASDGTFTPSNGVSGSWTTTDGKTITATNGIITAIV